MIRILLACIMSTVFSLNSHIFYYKKIPLNVSTSHIEFAWDLHDVLFTKRSSLLVLKALKHVGPLTKLGFSRKTKHKIIRKKLKALKKSGATGQAYYQLLLAHNQQAGAKAIKELAAQQKPIVGMEPLVCELAHLGYTQRIASNIGDIFLAELQSKKKNAHICSHLSKGTLALYDQGSAVRRKPDTNFFIDHTTTYNADGTKIIIFIDDKVENVHAACKAGWVGILFENAKQLRTDLIQIGIPVKKA